MTALIYITMFGWIPFVLALFALMPPRRAVITALIVAWLFLPMTSFRFPGVPDYSKVSATSVAVLLGVMIFDSGRLLSFRFSFLDLPMLLWCLAPSCASISNALGLYDALSVFLTMLVTWGLPYLVGRLYFSDEAGLKELVIGLFIGGLVYAPFCLWEIRMSPRLHQTVYGFRQHAFGQTKRLGGYRPMVFMQHGLMVAMWMAVTSLAGFWLWYTGALTKLRNYGIGWPVAILSATAVLCKSSAALLLLLFGSFALVAVRRLRTTALLIVMVAAAPAYMLARTVGGWSGRSLISAAESVSEAQAESLRTRIDSEDILMAKAADQPYFGWGGWGRGMVKDKHGQYAAIPDGLWIITLSKHGAFGVATLTLTLLFPAFVLVKKVPLRLLGSAEMAPPAIVAVLSMMYMLDCLLNAMVNPVFAAAIAGLTGYVSSLRLRPQRSSRRMARQAPLVSTPAGRLPSIGSAHATRLPPLATAPRHTGNADA